MPPEVKTDRAAILAAALDLVREQGPDALTARTVARRLGCSVQPIFRCFQSMAGLTQAVVEQAWAQYNQVMLTALSGEPGGFSATGLAYIRFARAEPQLFRLLFLSDHLGGGRLDALAGSTEGDDRVLELLCAATGLSPALAQALYTSVWLTTHGIAVTLATNGLEMDDKEIQSLLKRTYDGLVLTLSREMEGQL